MICILFFAVTNRNYINIRNKGTTLLRILRMLGNKKVSWLF